MKGSTRKIKPCISAFLLFLTLSVSFVTHGISFDSTKMFFAGDSSTTFCRESTGGPDLYQQSLFSRLQVSPPPGFIIEPQQDIISRDPCGISDPDGSGYGGLKILDWNTECTDTSGNGICGWTCYDCPDPECEINRSALPLGGEADWCCCGSRRACIDQSDAQYVILNLAGNDLLQLFKFYGGDVDLVLEEAKSLTNYVTAQGRTAIWLNFYPIAYGSLGGGETSCSNSLSCLFATNSNAEYFYGQFMPWIASQPNAYLIDFFGYIKETYAQNPSSFINTYGYDGIHLKPSGHQIYYEYVYPHLTAIVTEINDQDGDGIPDDEDNCPNHPNGPARGTCVTTKAGMIASYRAGDPKGYITCDSDDVCTSTGGICQLIQGDGNNNGVGDACECYANFNYPGDFMVNISDFALLKDDYGRIDCAVPPECQADGNNDGRVNTSDLSLLRNEYGRIDCPALP